ncbi:putative mucin TcMUCII [Trypanosoma cruzi]|uniref:Mucin TcMUCII, putative n=2 Tax=Trypanosoma cruzi TaxID=5693 RepID=Q4DSN3_TRYCC|nr:mucin TcMUCII, putative [Trypanosoma cruzi]EAN95543.1 mucin TcMUCII, putative [Trypanosoma cruzi]PWU90936.1 putative mucin TcMUCII [Trypanosoma cruzi]|eukprot:XP_817394.1 mucin TcMUCII [Trypanosoma cruzi strain CL Brener]
MMTCRLLCALLVLALCCCPSVCVTATGEEKKEADSSTTASPPGTSGTGQANTSTGPSSTVMNVTLPVTENQDARGEASDKTTDTGKRTDGVAVTSGITGNSAEQPVIENHKSQGASSENDTVQKPAEEQKSGTTRDTGQETGKGSASPETSDKASPEHIPKEGAGGSDGSGSSGGSANSNTSSISVTGTVPAQIQKENAPTTTTTTTTKAPTTTTTTTTEAPTTTTTTRAPSLLRESDGSLSSSAWVCAPLLLAVSALAYTTLG